MSSQIDDPQTLRGLFPPDSDDDDDDNEDNCDDNKKSDYDEYCYEIQSIELVNKTIQIRQYDYHSHNANRIWPGTFPLAEYLLSQHEDECNTRTIDDIERKTTGRDNNTTEKHEILINDGNDATGKMSIMMTTTSSKCTRRRYKNYWGRILELGTATGLLSIRLLLDSDDDEFDHQEQQQQHEHAANRNIEKLNCCYSSIVTSDVDDNDYDDNPDNNNNTILHNLFYNYKLNHIRQPYPYHIPHTWGTGWNKSVQKVGNNTTTPGSSSTVQGNSHHVNHLLVGAQPPFDTIIASDILLYVSTYPALVQTLCELMIPPQLQHQVQEQEHEDCTVRKTNSRTKFIMSWNRRLKNDLHHEFFTRMIDKGFVYEHHGRGVYTFVYNQ